MELFTADKGSPHLSLQITNEVVPVPAHGVPTCVELRGPPVGLCELIRTVAPARPGRCRARDPRGGQPGNRGDEQSYQCGGVLAFERGDGNQGEAQTTLQKNGRAFSYQVKVSTSAADLIPVFADVHTSPILL